MQPTHNGRQTLLLALLWALSLGALCVTLAIPVASETMGVGWTRTLPASGVWFLAALALGLCYRRLGRMEHGFRKPRLWLLAVLFAGVATFGESFAQTGTAELVLSRRWISLLYLIGRIPACYMGMALLLEALTTPYAKCAPEAHHAVDAPAAPPRSAYVNGATRQVFPALTGNQPTQTRNDGSATTARYAPVNAQPQQTGRVRADGKTTAAPDTAKTEKGLASSAGDTFPAKPVWQPRTQAGYDRTAALGEGTSPRTTRDSDRSDGSQSEARPSAALLPPHAAAQQPPYPKHTPAQGAGTALPGMARAAQWPTWAFVLLLLLCWLPYLFAVWPGTVSNDSITQLAEIFGRKALGNGNPVFQTGLVWLAVTVGKGLFGSADAAVALYVCTQGLIMAWLLGYTLRRMQEAHAPAWLVMLATAFYALCPVFPTFAFCMGKDTGFAIATLWLSLMAWRVLESKWPPMRTSVGLCLSAALCALMRNAGVALTVVTLLGLLIWATFAHTRQWRAPLIALLVTGAAVLALYGVALPQLRAAATPETENWSVPLQQVARTVASEPLTDADRASLYAVLPVDELAAAYNGELSDPVKALWREGVSAAQKRTFWETWLRLGLKHPATYASATFHNAYGYLLPGYVSTIKPTFLMGMEGRTTLIDGAFDFTVNPVAITFKATLQSLFSVAPFRLLVAPGAYGWLTLFAFVAAMGCYRRRNALCMLPALITLLGCLFSAVNGYFRYAMPLYFITPALLAMLSQALRSGPRRAPVEQPRQAAFR